MTVHTIGNLALGIGLTVLAGLGGWPPFVTFIAGALLGSGCVMGAVDLRDGV